MKYFAPALTIFVIAGAAFCVGCGPNSGGSKLRELQRIESTLPVFPSLNQISVHQTSKATVAGISKLYKSDATYDDVKRFYVAELTQKGWEYIAERPIKDWGADFGGRELVFRDNEYQFSIQYAGENANYNWNYAIGIGWGR